MKSFLVKLKIRHGEQEFYSHAILNTRTPNTAAEKIAKNFYGDGSGQKGDDGYYFNDGTLHVSVHAVRDLTKAQKDALIDTGVAYLATTS
jgi:alanyl-tRNA synthetase